MKGGERHVFSETNPEGRMREKEWEAWQYMSGVM